MIQDDVSTTLRVKRELVVLAEQLKVALEMMYLCGVGLRRTHSSCWVTDNSPFEVQSREVPCHKLTKCLIY